jgi:mRNA interferase RelE/StbE
MKIYQSGSFQKKVKKMSKSEKDALDQEIKKIAENSAIGEEKKGDLRGVFVHKFKPRAAQCLLAYRKAGDDLENHYRDLKQYLKNR